MPVQPLRRFPISSFPVVRPALIGALLVIWFGETPVHAQDDIPPNDEAQQRSQQRLQLMHNAVNELAAESTALSEERLQFAETPILRYNDQLRQFFDATVWRLGTEGRPTALLTLEWYGSASGRAKLMREFCSLSEEPFIVTMPGVTWKPQGTDLKMRLLPDAPVPAAMDAQRLIQMRAMARRFHVETNWLGERQELRLVPQPIDRYTDTDARIIDGGIFSFATGTNPELALLLEASEEKWSYGTIRVALASLDVSLDGQQIASYPRVINNNPDGSYFSTAKRVNLSD